MKKMFNGLYFKHQKDDRSVSFIAGSSDDHAFIQVITNDGSHYIRYPLSAHVHTQTVAVGDSVFSRRGVNIRIDEPDLSINGEIKYSGLTPLRYDIMGPFRYLPMQCSHRIISLHHKLEGSVTIDGETIDFIGGAGYVEGDKGASFPKNYMWVQCNDFAQKACVTLSVADVPFAGLCFRGCVGVVYFGDTEYRFATYLGAKIVCCNENLIIIKQGKLLLEIEIDAGTGHGLLAPDNGEMTRHIRERIACGAKFRLTRGSETLFEKRSQNASFERVTEQ